MISIVVPLYNKEHCIRQTLSSILSQNYQEFEIIVVNDGSTDKSVDVVNSINDDRIILINKDNEGVSKTRNRGIKEVKGEWVFFLDADDLMEKGCLQSLMELSAQFPEANILSGNFITRKDNKEIDSAVIKDNCLITNPYELIWNEKWHFRLGSFIAKKDIIPFFQEDIAKGEDFMFFVNLLKKGVIAHTPKTTMIYILENSELSKKALSPEKCLTGNLIFKDANTYLKSIYVDLLIKDIIVYFIRYKRIDYSLKLLKQHIVALIQYLPLYIYRTLRKLI